MSLSLLLPPEAAAELLAGWPDKPEVHPLPTDSVLPRIINGPKLADFLTTGCVPAGMVNVIDRAALRHPNSYTTGGRLDPAKISHWMQAGCTVQARKMDLWFPPMAKIVGALREETGCDGYVSGFLTPGAGQGLQYHWDQTTAIIVQLEGAKTWEMWAPIVEAPYRDYFDSVNHEGLSEVIPELQERGPDLEVDLEQGQVMVLPRGWIHNPHSLKFDGRSTHVTFVLQERTPHWIAERLVRAAIADPRMRQALAANSVVGRELPLEVVEARDLLIEFLDTIDPAKFAEAVREVALSERSFA